MDRERELKRLQRAQAFDRKTLAAIYDDYHPLVYRYIYRRIGDVETARDLTAETFRRFLQVMHQGKGPSTSLRAWLYRVAHNIVIDHYRRQQHRQHLPLKEELCGEDNSPDKTVELNLLSRQVRKAIVNLTDDQQEVIALKFFEGLSNQEVSQVIGKSTGAVKSLQHRALATLQRQLVQKEEEVST